MFEFLRKLVGAPCIHQLCTFEEFRQALKANKGVDPGAWCVRCGKVFIPSADVVVKLKEETMNDTKCPAILPETEYMIAQQCVLATGHKGPHSTGYVKWPNDIPRETYQLEVRERFPDGQLRVRRPGEGPLTELIVWPLKLHHGGSIEVTRVD